jgi:hypothetical protein
MKKQNKKKNAYNSVNKANNPILKQKKKKKKKPNTKDLSRHFSKEDIQIAN